MTHFVCVVRATTVAEYERKHTLILKNPFACVLGRGLLHMGGFEILISFQKPSRFQRLLWQEVFEI
jgi:hypothetical protein